MIKYTQGNILHCDAEALVNTVNCVGVMGKGIALQFRKAYPENYKEYEKACKIGTVVPGRMFVHETGGLTNPRYIINFPTKRHWRGKSRFEDIEEGLNSLVTEIEKRNITSIAIPPLGSGLGGLNWKEVRQSIEAALGKLKHVEVMVFEPLKQSALQTHVINNKVPNMTPGRAALIGLMNRYLGALMDPFISLLEIHKLMYFLQEAGEPLRLRFNKGPYGPFAENLRHVLLAVEGYLVSGYKDDGDEPTQQISLVPGAIQDASKFLEKHNTTQNHFKKVTKLVDGFETPFGLELLSTVHWVTAKEGAKNPREIKEKAYSWNDRKKRFSPNQLSLAAEQMESEGWITNLSC